MSRQRWLSLRRTAGGQSRAPPASQVDIVQSEYGCKNGISLHQPRLILRDLCTYYLSGFPELPNRSSNTSVQGLANGLINGHDISRWMIEEPRLTILHRTNIIKWAIWFKNLLGLDLPDCNRFYFDQWEMSVPKRRGQDTAKYDLFQDCRLRLRRARIFPLPPMPSNHGHLPSLSYSKATEYLTAVFMESRLSPPAD